MMLTLLFDRVGGDGTILANIIVPNNNQNSPVPLTAAAMNIIALHLQQIFSKIREKFL